MLAKHVDVYCRIGILRGTFDLLSDLNSKVFILNKRDMLPS